MKAEKTKLKPMRNISYRFMALAYKISSPFCSVQRQINLLNLKKGMVVVDWGCGPGRHTIPVAQYVRENGKVFAVDIHPLAIETIREKAKQKEIRNIEPILIDSYDSGIQDSSVDLVLLIDTVPIVEDTQPLFKEIHRLLKKNGRLYISHSHLSMEKTRKIVEDSGLFTVLELKGHDMIVVPFEKQDNKSP
jgi:ubiquinone/menaquinone biosynthesis C-methylase UbiE